MERRHTHTHRHTCPNIFGQTASDWISVWKSITWLHHVRACVPRNHLINARPHIKVPAHTHQACRCGHGDNSDTINDVRLCFRWPAAEGGKKKEGVELPKTKKKKPKMEKIHKVSRSFHNGKCKCSNPTKSQVVDKVTFNHWSSEAPFDRLTLQQKSIHLTLDLTHVKSFRDTVSHIRGADK